MVHYRFATIMTFLVSELTETARIMTYKNIESHQTIANIGIPKSAIIPNVIIIAPSIFKAILAHNTVKIMTASI